MRRNQTTSYCPPPKHSARALGKMPPRQNRATPQLSRLWILMILAFASLGVAPAQSSPNPNPPPPARIPSLLSAASAELSGIYLSARPSVVIVESPPINAGQGAWDDTGESTTDTDQNSKSELTDTATGIVVSSDGFIVTNHHVIQNVLSEFVRVKLNSGEIVKARIVGTDPKTDLAVLQLPSTVQSPAPLPPANSDQVKTGDFVCAIGSPYGLEYSLTVGIVSGRGRNPLTHSAYEDYIQTDAAINPGNSGGPLINDRGEWVGVNTLMNGINRGLGFAIPSNQAMAVTQEIIARGSVRRAWIGVRAEVETGLVDSEGVRLSWVEEGSPAAAAGLQKGDTVLKVDGTQVRTPADLQRKIWDCGIGGTIKMEVRRGKSTKLRKVKAVEMRDSGVWK